ncbi:hypothetical protein ACSBR2_035619 [Camellia fascicularis]
MARVPLICFDIIDWHLLDLVLRQFGRVQSVPDRFDAHLAMHFRDRRGKMAIDWAKEYQTFIGECNNRRNTIVHAERSNEVLTSSDPYMLWFRRHTRLVLSNPSDIDAFGYQGVRGSLEGLILDADADAAAIFVTVWKEGRHEDCVIIISSKDSDNTISDAENALRQIASLILKVAAAGYDRQAVADHASNLASKIQSNLTNSMKALGVDILTGVGTILEVVILVLNSMMCIQHLEVSKIYPSHQSNNSTILQVTFVEAVDQLMPGFDLEIGKLAQRVLVNPRKNDYHTGVFASKITPAKDGKPVMIELIDAKTKEPKDTLEVDAALIATGRAPHTKGLGLENINVETQRGFVPVDERMRVIDANGKLVPNLYCIGDANEKMMLAASTQGISVVEQVCGKDHVLNHLSIPVACFTHPEISMVGLTEPQAREKAEKEGFEVSVAKTSFKAHTKALAENEGKGLAKLIYRLDNGEILGVHIFGLHAADLIHEASNAIALGTRIQIDNVGMDTVMFLGQIDDVCMGAIYIIFFVYGKHVQLICFVIKVSALPPKILQGNTMTNSIVEVFKQAAVRYLLNVLKSKDFHDHESMIREACFIFCALDALFVDSQPFKEQAEEFIGCAA